jgi:sulfate adenylyltransferase large subunit/phosphoadenylyl-sulfate reductase (thioredoxin)
MNVAVSPRIANPLPTARPLVRIVIVGHVDHGKSTLIGRLLHETGSLPEGKLDTLKAVSARRGMTFEWSFLLDALQTERDQGITIDTSQIRFRTASRDIVLIDAPGHAEFLRNMITGAAQADAALLIVDASEGVRDQTRRHGYLLHLLGVRQVAVVINKMDRIGFDATRFRAIEIEITEHLSGLGLTPTAVIPISARNGDGVARHSAATAWYQGPTVLEALDTFTPARSATDLALRFPVQAIYKFDDRRIIAGRIESGRIGVGDEVVIVPGDKRARVRSIEAWPVPDAGQAPRTARTGQSIGITLDRELFIERGNVIAAAAAPATTAKRLRARVFWLNARPLAVGGEIVARIGTAAARAVVRTIDDAVDPGLLASDGAEVIEQNHVGEIEIELAQPLATDPYTADAGMGRIALEFDGRIAGGGLVLAVTPADPPTSWPGLSRPSRSAWHGASLSGTRGTSRRVTAEGRQHRSDALAAQAVTLARLFAALSPEKRIAHLRRELAGRIVFTTSFGLEDQAILHLIAERGGDIEIATLDTGRLFPATHALWAETERRYGLRIRALYPRHDDLEALIERQGINGFYESRAARIACCQVRKIEPLARALAGARGWIAGLRAEQSAHRRDMALVTAERGLIKLNPIFDWTRQQLLDFVAANHIPVNPLHAKGFASIGCAPCTRAIAPGEDERAGRWWWEGEEKKECGLHLRNTKPPQPSRRAHP